MNNEDARYIARQLTAYYGLTLEGDLRPDEQRHSIHLRPTDMNTNEGFQIRITPGWRTLECEFLPDSYAGELIREMGISKENRGMLETLMRSALEAGCQLTIRINDSDQIPDPSTWPESWNRISMKMRSPFLAHDDDLQVAEETPELVIRWAGLFLSMLITLLPVEEVEEEYVREILEAVPEGTPHRAESIRYERSRVNRAACIALQGTRCRICDMDFGEIYGTIGAGFIHVHHRVPISQVGSEYIPDPGRDLIPVCPNCHAMLHRSDPPAAPEELRRIIEENLPVE